MMDMAMPVFLELLLPLRLSSPLLPNTLVPLVFTMELMAMQLPMLVHVLLLQLLDL